MAEEGALAIEGPEAADPFGTWGSECDVGIEGGVAGIDGKLEAFWNSTGSANKEGSLKYD